MSQLVAIPDDFQTFAEEQVRAGLAATVDEVVQQAFAEKRLAALRDALDVGLNEAAEGRYANGTPQEIMDRLRKRHGIP